MKRFLLALAGASVLLLSGCTTVKYNGTETKPVEIDYPERDKVVTAYVGDHMVSKGTMSEAKVLVVTQEIKSLSYDVMPGEYQQMGYDHKQTFYSPIGVDKSFIADPLSAVAIDKNQSTVVCVVTVFGVKACMNALGAFEERTVISSTAKSFQQTLIYSGRVKDKINIGYREFSNDTARPAFNNDVEYDLSDSKTIGYKGALIEVVDANNSSINYKLIRNFP